jgi:hypothetical protein
MNTRIRELITQAGTDSSGKWMSVDNAEKFAQLIVADCVMFINTGAAKFSDSDWSRTSVRDIGAMIQQHFGTDQ